MTPSALQEDIETARLHVGEGPTYTPFNTKIGSRVLAQVPTPEAWVQNGIPGNEWGEMQEWSESWEEQIQENACPS